MLVLLPLAETKVIRSHPSVKKTKLPITSVVWEALAKTETRFQSCRSYDYCIVLRALLRILASYFPQNRAGIACFWYLQPVCFHMILRGSYMEQEVMLLERWPYVFQPHTFYNSHASVSVLRGECYMISYLYSSWIGFVRCRSCQYNPNALLWFSL